MGIPIRGLKRALSAALARPWRGLKNGNPDQGIETESIIKPFPQVRISLKNGNPDQGIETALEQYESLWGQELEEWESRSGD